MTINRGGEQPHQQHEAPAGSVDQETTGQVQPELVFAQECVHAYIDYLDKGLGEPWRRPLREGFRWFLEDALAVPTDQLSADEARCLEWLSGWDHWTVENVGKLINRARSLAYEEGRQAARRGEAISVRVEAS